MNTPGTLALLGYVMEITIKDKQYEYVFSYPIQGNDSMLMCSDEKGKSLYIITGAKPGTIPSQHKVNKRSRAIAQTSKLFSTWNQGKSASLKLIKFKDSPLKIFGQAGYIVYYSEKWDDNEQYIHNFENKTDAYIRKSDSKDSPTFIKLVGKKLKITELGIEG